MQNKYDRHSTAELGVVLAQVKLSMDGLLVGRAIINGQSVGVQSLRLRTFQAHGTSCSCCSLRGKFFALERNQADAKRDGRYHLNLYGHDSNGNEVLFTHDHTLARGLGGADGDLGNTSTMCSPCNHRKSKQEAKAVQKLRTTLLNADVGQT